MTQNYQWRIQESQRGRQPLREHLPIIWHDFCRKLHENEKKLDLGGARILALPRSATDY